MLVEDVSVMVVEDDAFQRRMLVRILTDMGVKKIDQAPEGNSALNMLLDRIEPIDIVISDLDMPTMDGMELIRHLGEQQSVGSVIVNQAAKQYFEPGLPRNAMVGLSLTLAL